MHHPFVPAVVLEGPDDECDWLAFLGTFDSRFSWGDGTEANYPQYGILRTRGSRAPRTWDDGLSLQLLLESETGAEDFTHAELRFRHAPGVVEWRPREVRCWDRLTVTAPPDESCLRFALRLQRGSLRRVILRVRLLARRLTVAPDRHVGPIDVLDAPFGFQRMEVLELAPHRSAQGVRARIGSLDQESFVVSDPPPTDVLLGKADANSAQHAAASRSAQPTQVAPAPCFDVELRIDSAGVEELRWAIGVRRASDRGSVRRALEATPEATVRDLEAPGRALEFRCADSELEALWRFSRSVAHALVWPNGVITTGALGYGAKCHVAQDVPFVHPLYSMDPHPQLQRAARRTLEFVADNPAEGKGILDHPCDGLDFAFVPLRPRRARIFKEYGAAGILRWIIALEAYWAHTGDAPTARRALRRLADVVVRHGLPFHPRRRFWSVGEETQGRAYAWILGAAALRALARMQSRAGEQPSVAARAAAVLRRWVMLPVERGGLMVRRPVRRALGTLDSGWIVDPHWLARRDEWFAFDVPLVSGHALMDGVLPRHAQTRLAARFCEPENPWLVEGAGFAKCQGGRKGTWFWHNAVVARGLVRCGRVDEAFLLFRWMARGLADINGLGIPGEEINGGDYAMGIGALAGQMLIEGILGLERRGDRVVCRPVLPSGLDHWSIRELQVGGVSTSVEVVRGGDGPRICSRSVELRPGEETRVEL